MARADDSRLNALTDLKGKVVATPGVANFGAFRSQAYELLQVGIKAPDDFSQLLILPSQRQVVEALLMGKADVAFVRDGVWEELIAQGVVPPHSLKVINPLDDPPHPFQRSTRLYPE